MLFDDLLGTHPNFKLYLAIGGISESRNFGKALLKYFQKTELNLNEKAY